MPRVKIPAKAGETVSVEIEIARVRGLDFEALRSRWHAMHGRRAPAHAPKHLLFRMLAYRLQTDAHGDLDANSRRILDRTGLPEQAGQKARGGSRRPKSGRAGRRPRTGWERQ